MEAGEALAAEMFKARVEFWRKHFEEKLQTLGVSLALKEADHLLSEFDDRFMTGEILPTRESK
jgi:hypothetical protein